MVCLLQSTRTRNARPQPTHRRGATIRIAAAINGSRACVAAGASSRMLMASSTARRFRTHRVGRVCSKWWHCWRA